MRLVSLLRNGRVSTFELLLGKRLIEPEERKARSSP
jgi:hypothetical protein